MKILLAAAAGKVIADAAANQPPAQSINYNLNTWVGNVENLGLGGVNLKSIIKYSNKYFLGCDGGVMGSGPNLATLTSQVVSNNTGINRMAAGNGVIVLGLGNGRVYTSHDNGATWVQNFQATSFLGTVVNCVTFINGEFVITGGGSTGCKSTDGINWTDISTALQPMYNSTTAQIGGIIFDGTNWVAAGGNKRIGYGPSLSNPFSVEIVSASTNFQGIGFNGSKYMAVGTNGAIYTSTDRINWVKDTSLSVYWGTNTVNGVVWDGYKWIIFGDRGKFASMVPGEGWITYSSLGNLIGTRDINNIFLDTDKVLLAIHGTGADKIYSTVA